MYQTHHGDDSRPQDGSTISQSYRFLDGVVGIEDIDYHVSQNGYSQNIFPMVEMAEMIDLDAEISNFEASDLTFNDEIVVIYKILKK